jgi:penicillin-binding protein 1B
VVTVLVAATVFIPLLLLAGVSWRYSLPEPGTSAPAIHLYAGREPVGTIYPAHRAQGWVPLARMPRSVVDAVIVAEDHRFWSHAGVDALAVTRALEVNLKHGGVRQGASTITQQLARTLFLDTERTWSRKVREMVIALMLEVRYSKDRILETYLNTVYLGQDGDVPVYGFPAAARRFLGKDVTALEIQEAAWLAGAIRAPNRLLRPEGRGRRDEILTAMHEQGLIDLGTMRKAASKPVPSRSSDFARTAPYFVDFVAAELARRAQLPASGEIDLQTTLDPALQRTAEAAVRNEIARIERARPQLAGRVQAAVLAIVPGSGEIRALVGGRNYRESTFNRATRAARQPGSVFKPFVYLAAFEAQRQGLTPASLISDEPLSVRAAGVSWEPKNMDGQFHGPVTVRRALEQSLNVPAIRVALEVGPGRVVDVAHAMGIEHALAPVPSLALGTSEVSLLEMTSAFGTLANGGIRVVPTSLASDSSGAGPALAYLPSPTRAVTAESAFMITNLLRGVMRWGTGARSSAWGLQNVAAGKTGTSDELRDAWFIGYTPDLVVGVWVGLDDGSPLGFTGSQAALPIWGPVMQAAVGKSSPTPFRPPPGVVLANVDRLTGKPVSLWCGSDDVVQEAFREGTVPAEGCDSVIRTGVTAALDWFQNLLR